MRRVAIVLFAAALLYAGLSMQGRTGFSGTYSINGTNPGVGAYTGTLRIVPRGDVYDVSWSIAKEHYTGVGIVVNDTLSVAYTGSDHSWFGVASYRQRSDGTLDGRWAVHGGAKIPGTEIATRK
jgi:hypothetical protein